MRDENTNARCFYNHERPRGAFVSPGRAPSSFHQTLAGYAPTPLLEAPQIARLLGLGRVFLKLETDRLGLPAFKILGASWAIHRTLATRSPALPPPVTLVTATDGNHGRAVAHMARRLGLAARIFVPAHTAPARIHSIAREGASVEVIEGTYDDAVAHAAAQASDDCLVISDTSWPGYEAVPRWVAEGYSTIFYEIDDELARRGEAGPDLIAVQTGVGALAAAVVNHYRQPERQPPPAIVSVEPLRAACLLVAMEAGEIVTVPGPHDSIMAGLNCGRASILAWPILAAGVDAFLAIADERARQAMRLLGAIGVVAGETGAAGLAGLLELLTGPENARHREALRLRETTRALVLVTEGATDPEAYARIVP